MITKLTRDERIQELVIALVREYPQGNTRPQLLEERIKMILEAYMP
jgi:hypothetical protein